MANITQFIDQINIADSLDDEKLDKIGVQVVEGYLTDLTSRSQWEKKYDDWIKLATLVTEQKSYPWNKASNVKYPLIATAAMQFSARAYPTLIPSNGKVVLAEVIGKDLQGEKKNRADRISKHMSYQLLKEQINWEEDMDRLLITVPIVGNCFKKTYWDKETEQNCSKLILAKDLIVNYWSKSLEATERVTERIEMSPRKLRERQLAGIFKEIELETPSSEIRTIDRKNISDIAPSKDDETTPHILLEQHTFLDLDNDDYSEPYIITVEEKSRKVLRIAARFRQEDVVMDSDGEKIIRINPIQYYTKFGFIPNPDGGFYDIGFGLLLGPLNESVNTLINQLIDSGSLANLQSGFIGKGLRLKAGEQKLAPGTWIPVNATGDDLKKQIVPLPAKEPSTVLFQLLGTLITSGKELASVAEIFVGKMPGQNTPATTTMASIEQGMKVFTAIYKRIYRALAKEYKKLFKLNSIYLDEKTYVNILDEPIGPEDYNQEDYDVCPGADPSAISSTEKLVKAQGLMELLPLGTLNIQEVTKRILDAQDQPQPDLLLKQGPPPPDPKAMEAQAKMQLEQQKAQMKMQIDAMKAEMDQRSNEQKMMMEAQMKQLELSFKEQMMSLDLKSKVISTKLDMSKNVQEHQMDMKMAKDDMAVKTAEHEMKMKQAKEKPKPNGNK